MAFINDCKYEENLVARFETATRELLTPNLGQETIDYMLLNRNTLLLNNAISEYANAKDETAKTKTLTRNVKDQFRDKYVPKEIVSLYTSTDIVSVTNLLDFVKHNQSYFQPFFSNDRQVITSLGNIDPSSFSTFANEFPTIYDRIESGPITAAEVSDMLATNGMSQNTFSSYAQSNPKNVLSILESFLSKLGIGARMMGSFCSLVENVFSLVNGQKDVFNNATGFSPDFQRIVSSINPNIGQVTAQISKVTTLLQKAKTDTGDIRQNMQNAFSLLSSAFGLAMNFFNSDTGQGGSIEVEWDLAKVKTAITGAGSRFLVIIESTGNPLGDVNQDGIVDSSDADLFQEYIDETAAEEVVNYIENVMLNYMNENLELYSDLVLYEGDSSEPGFQDALIGLSAAVSLFGSPSSPQTGDFGLSDITQMIAQVSGLASSVQSLLRIGTIIDTKRVTSRLDQIAQTADSAISKMHGDLNNITKEFKSVTAKTLKEAERVSVTTPTKTAEISTKNQEALKENISKALKTVGENVKTLGPKLTRSLNVIRKSVAGIAAVGVLDTVKTQLNSVVDTSVAQLKAMVGSFNPASIANGVNFNMKSSFEKMASLRADAQNAASEETTAQVKKILEGKLATATEKFRERKKEEVDFVALRFCKLAGEIERIYAGVTNPLKAMQSSFDSANASFGPASGEATLNAIRAGASRYDSAVRRQAMERAGTLPATVSKRYVDPATGLITTVPPQGSVPQGGFGPAPPLPDGFQFPSYDEARRGARGVLYAPGPSSAKAGPAGFIPKSAGGGVDVDSLHRLYLLAQRWGRTITVVSAYRPPEVNNSIPGAAKNSYHKAGKAFDCDINTYEEQLQFANLAYLVGFRGIGSYLGGSTFVHIDTGETRSWRGGSGFRYYDLPGPAGAKNRG